MHRFSLSSNPRLVNSSLGAVCTLPSLQHKLSSVPEAVSAACRIAYFHEEEYESAVEALEKAKELGAAGEVDRWLGKCKAELEGMP